MADEVNIPTHRWYQNRNHIKLPMQDVSEYVIKATGIAKIDKFMITTASDALFAAGEIGVWYDPSDLTTLFQDSAGTTPVTAAGQPVGLMLDKSGQGNHATQATSAQRPTYGLHPYYGVRNTATGSAALTNSVYWRTAPSTQNGVTITNIGYGLDVDGLPYVDISLVGTATALAAMSAGYLSGVGRTAALTGEVWTSSCYAQKISGTAAGEGFNLLLVAETMPAGTYVSNTFPVFNGTTRTLVTSSYTVAGAANSVQTFMQFRYPAGTVLNEVFRISGLQLEKSSVRTAFQSNLSQYNITEVGVPSVYYLSFDGVDDGMVTGTITPNTDKVQVFAGIRKLSDPAAAGGLLVETSADTNTNNGSYAIFAPATAATGNFGIRSKGTVTASVNTGASWPAPATVVLTATGDISSSVAKLRINTTQQAEVLTAQGIGNFLSYPIYIGRRGGSSSPFNGNIYGLVVRFGQNLTAVQVASTEAWVNGKTGAY